MNTPTKITVLSRIGEELIFERGSVYHDEVGAFGKLRWRVSDGSGWSSTINLSDEGFTWIRGHHDKDSTEVRALLTAYILRAA